MEGDSQQPGIPHSMAISIHSLRMEGDGRIPAAEQPGNISIHSLRMEGDSAVTVMPHCTAAFQSTPSAWRETSHTRHPLFALTFQSTPSAWRETFFEAWKNGNGTQFQSTPSAWRETNPIPDHLYQHFYFNPLPPHGGRHRAGYRWKVSEFHFNPLPPHGGRLNAPNSFLFVRSFQSTPSAWRETITMPIDFKKFNISIHSLRMEGD